MVGRFGSLGIRMRIATVPLAVDLAAPRCLNRSGSPVNSGCAEAPHNNGRRRPDRCRRTPALGHGRVST
jgi:hypothetical protein